MRSYLSSLEKNNKKVTLSAVGLWLAGENTKVMQFTVLWWRSCAQKGCLIPAQHYCIVPSVLLTASDSSDIGVCISLSLTVTCLAAKWADEYCLIFWVHHAISVFLASILDLEIQVVGSPSPSFSDYLNVISVVHQRLQSRYTGTNFEMVTSCNLPVKA